MDLIKSEALAVTFDGPICFIRFARPEVDNTITVELIKEFHSVLDVCTKLTSIVVLGGSDTAFCMGMDFEVLSHRSSKGEAIDADGDLLYSLWERLATGPYVVISHVEGRANAGGLGFVAASDVVIAGPNAEFSLSELLFGLLPACVFPFLVRRIGIQKANFLALTTLPIKVEEATRWGLVDECAVRSDICVRKHLARLRRISREAIIRQKQYTATLNEFLVKSKKTALAANQETFSNSDNVAAIVTYVETGKFPWDD